jgi:hypothetical protein
MFMPFAPKQPMLNPFALPYNRSACESLRASVHLNTCVQLLTDYFPDINGTMASLHGVHPEELSRRISEIDLTSVRHRADTQTGDRPRYTPEELLQLRPAHEPHGDDQHTVATGVKTPADVPAPPPPTPNHGPGTPEEKLTGAKLNGDIPQEDQPKKKKKKKRSGRNKKPAPTGFEGLCNFPASQ